MSSSSLLYLHKKTLSSNEISSDVTFLLDLLKKEGSKKKRWEVYLDENEVMFEDGDVHSHSALLEELAYREAMIEGLSEDQVLLLIWTARFHDLGELKNGDITYNLKTSQDDFKEASYVRSQIHSKLQSEYAKNMLEKTLAVSLEKGHPVENGFDMVDFFNSLENRGYMNTALKMIDRKSISKWDVLVAMVFFNHIVPLVNHGKKYRSVRVYLRKNAELITRGLENHFTAEHLSRGFEMVHGKDGFEEKKKFLDISPGKLAEIKNAWLNFVQEN